MSDPLDAMRKDPAGFWEARYRSASPTSTGRPGTVLQQLVEPLAPGRALELGAGKGDDAVWLARQGWSVVAVEIAASALAIVEANAARAGVQVTLAQHDLSQTFPSGTFDLVVASFLAALPRDAVNRRAAAAVAPGGHLLFVDHGSRAPWSWASVDHPFATAEETLAALELPDDDWERGFVGSMERLATGPGGQQATVLDNVVFLRRRA